MRIMYDAVDVAALPPGGDLYLAYIDGAYANEAAVRARFPGVSIVRTAVFASTTGADVYDVERGDVSPPQTPSILGRERATGRNPTLYVNGDNWNACRSAIISSGQAEPPWFLAHPTSSPVIVSGTVATQWNYQGTYDESAVADVWPGVDTVPVPPAIDPPFLVSGPIVDWQLASSFPAGARLLTASGAVYALGSAPYLGGANARPYFAGREAARFDWPTAAEQGAGKVYVIVATSGERYAFPE